MAFASIVPTRSRLGAFALGADLRGFFAAFVERAVLVVFLVAFRFFGITSPFVLRSPHSTSTCPAVTAPPARLDLAACRAPRRGGRSAPCARRGERRGLSAPHAAPPAAASRHGAPRA